jgi:protein-S-isoprenylcysteine O-methyltransferase Ste14
VLVSLARGFFVGDHKFENMMVTNGLFKFNRNPIYLGFLISLLRVWVLLGTVFPIIGCLLFILITNFWYISCEEKEMEKQFGAEYREYKSRVDRWI